MLKLVYGDAAVTIKMVYKLFERFRNGCESVEDEERSGRPSASQTQENGFFQFHWSCAIVPLQIPAF